VRIGAEVNAFLRELKALQHSRNVLLGEMCQWNDNVQVVEDEPAIEISKT